MSQIMWANNLVEVERARERAFAAILLIGMMVFVGGVSALALAFHYGWIPCLEVTATSTFPYALVVGFPLAAIVSFFVQLFAWPCVEDCMMSSLDRRGTSHWVDGGSSGTDL